MFLLGVPGAGAAKPPRSTTPLAPGVDFTLFSKGTTTDAFEIKTEGPTRIEWAEVSIAPHGTTGLEGGDGIVVATVIDGVATALASDGSACASRAVERGAAVVRPAGKAGEIRNDTSEPLELIVVTLTPRDRVAAQPAGACPAAAANGVNKAVFNKGVVETPLNTETKGAMDVWVGLVEFAPGSNIGWHIQPKPVLLGVGEGRLTLALAGDAACDVKAYDAGKAFFEPPTVNHNVSNDTSQKASMYGLVFAPPSQFPYAPAGPPQGC